MYIDQITYIATNWAAKGDDIFTLDITGMKDGIPVRNILISGHSIPLSGSGFNFAADVDTLVIGATDLDFDGHVIDVGGGKQLQIPRTGSLTKTYEFDVRAGAAEAAKPYISSELDLVEATPEAAVSEAELPPKVGLGILGVLAIATIVLLVFGSRKKR